LVSSVYRSDVLVCKGIWVVKKLCSKDRNESPGICVVNSKVFGAVTTQTNHK
jgi:hypothetical protein